MDDKYKTAILNIVNTQKLIIGPLAIDMAKKVPDITFRNGNVEIVGDPVKILHALVKEYEVLFGELSVKVSRDSIKEIEFQPSELPEILR